uniref:GRIP domain-containing protein n=1 Tax=Onchocerca volvulus TaxID=6282 RepID=A0A8R1Y017_ONCVO
MYNQENHDKRRNDDRFILSLPFGTNVENKSYFKPIKLSNPYSDKYLEVNKKSSDDSDQNLNQALSVPQSNYDQSSESLSIDDSDLIDDSTSAAQLSTSSPISVTSASTSSFYPTLNIGNGMEISAKYAKLEQSQGIKSDQSTSRVSDRYKKYTAVKRRLSELYGIIEEKDEQLRVVRNELNGKDLEIGKLCDKIRALEYNCGRLQSMIESAGDESDQNQVKLHEIINERDGLLIRNASLSRQIEFEKREWSIERERLSMDLDDVTRELELQKMILNGESISEIVQRWQTKVFELEGMITDRDRAIRAQQVQISKLKESIAETDRISCADSSESQTKFDFPSFTYIKRLLLQYLTRLADLHFSSDEERMQLVRNMSSILHLSDEEQRQVWANLKSKIQIS